MITKMRLDDIPVELQTPLNGFAILGEVTTKEVGGGDYLQINVPLFYVPSQNDEKNGVAKDSADDLAKVDVSNGEEAKANGLRQFYARWNIKPEWFESSFLNALKSGQVSDSEKISYQMNVSGLTRQLFQSLGIADTDFEAAAEHAGQIVGFKASASKKDPDKLQIRAFYKGPKN